MSNNEHIILESFLHNVIQGWIPDN